MPLMNTLVNYGKARLLARVLGKVAGRNLAGVMVAAWVGKKAWTMYQNRKARTAIPGRYA